LKETLEKIVYALNHKIFKTSKKYEKELKSDEKEIKEIIKIYPILSWGGLFTIDSEDIEYICEYIKYNFLAENIKNGLYDFLIKKHKTIKNVEIANEFERLVEDLKFNFSKSIGNIEKKIFYFISNNFNIDAIISSKGIITFINLLLFINKFTENKEFFEIAKKYFEKFVDSKKRELFLNYNKFLDFKMDLGHILSEDFKKYAEEILNKKIEEVRKTNIANITCEKVVSIIKAIFQRRGWNEEDEAILNSLSKKSIKNCFKNSLEFTKICIEFYKWRKRIKGSNNFEKFLTTLKETIEELEIEKPRKDYIKNLLNSE